MIAGLNRLLLGSHQFFARSHGLLLHTVYFASINFETDKWLTITDSVSSNSLVQFKNLYYDLHFVTNKTRFIYFTLLIVFTAYCYYYVGL